jgi:hypothetical protein
MTKEERAEISRKNGAKSKGPTTTKGKARVSRNALKHGEYAKKLAHFINPHEVVLGHENRQEFVSLMDELIAIYQPYNQAALDILHDMAAARFQMDRLHRATVMQWNQALLTAGRVPNTVNPELREIEVMNAALVDLLSGSSILSKINRELSRLQTFISRCQRQIQFIHNNFPNAAPVQTQPDEDADVENTEVTNEDPEPDEEIKPEDQPPIFVTENIPHVIAAYKREFPGRKIVILPENPMPDYDDMPRAPRKAA